MRVNSAIAAVALVVGLGFSGASFAQGTTIAGAEVSEGDRVAVTNRCEELKTAADTSEIGESFSGEAGADATVSNVPAINEGDNALTTIDLETITYQDCVDGGWIQ